MSDTQPKWFQDLDAEQQAFVMQDMTRLPNDAEYKELANLAVMSDVTIQDALRSWTEVFKVKLKPDQKWLDRLHSLADEARADHQEDIQTILRVMEICIVAGVLPVLRRINFDYAMELQRLAEMEQEKRAMARRKRP